MAVTQYSLGQLNPVVYFINSAGEIALPPSTEDALKLKRAMNSRGFELREAGTLQEIDELQKYMETQERAKTEANYTRTEFSTAEARKAVRERLTSRMISSSTSQYEKDFIRAYLQVADDKRAKHRDRFLCDVSARFVQRDYDSPRKHYEDAANSIPDMKDTECKKCHKFRKLDQQEVCFCCLYNLDPNDLNSR